MGTVVIAEDVQGEALDALATRHRVVRAAAEPAALRGARALVVRNRTRVTRDLMAAAPALQIVARAGAGLDNIDVDAADELGLVVVAPLGVNALSVAEHSLGLVLALRRRIAELDASTRRGEWDRRPGRELAGGTWGILGAGATGRATARLAAAIGMNVLAHDPHVRAGDPRLADLGVELVDLPALAARSDVVSCHLPAAPETRGLVGRELLSAMRSGALLINVGRGEVVDEDALADALQRGEIAGAGLDVRIDEPPAIGRLERLDQVVLTPHVAGITVQSQARIADVLAAEIDAVLDGGAAQHAVGRLRRPARPGTGAASRR